MYIDKKAKEVLIDTHVDSIKNMNLDDEGLAQEAKALKDGLAIANLDQKNDIESKRVELEEEKFKAQIKFEKEKFKFDKEKWEEEKKIKEDELAYKKDMFEFERYKFSKEFEAQREDSKRNFIGNLVNIGVRAVLSAFFGAMVHSEFNKSMVIEHHEMGVVTPGMKDCNKIMKDLLRKEI